MDEELLARFVDLIVTGVNDECVPADSIVGVSVPRADLRTYYFPMNDAELHPVLGHASSVALREEGTAISQGTTGLKTWCAHAY